MAKRITQAQTDQIDQLLLETCSHQWQKVAYVVGVAMMNPSMKRNGLADADFASRIRRMVEEGKLLSQGNLSQIRYSEVRLPDQA
jgi:hypothetical protein